MYIIILALFYPSCSPGLAISPSDTKSLFLRCKAHDALGHDYEAFHEAAEVRRRDPHHKDLKEWILAKAQQFHKAQGDCTFLNFGLPIFLLFR